MNTVKRMLDVLHCRIEDILKSWAAYLTIANGNTVFGEQMNSITVMLRKKYKKYLQAIVEKIVSDVRIILTHSNPFDVALHPIWIETYHIWIEVINAYCSFQTQANRATRLKRILEETKETEGESEMRERMQALRAQLSDSMHNLHEVFSSRIFVAICRGFWDRLGQVNMRKKLWFLILPWQIVLTYQLDYRRLCWDFLRAERRTGFGTVDPVTLYG